MRIVYFGSGAFGLPTLRRLERDHDVALVVSQPDRPAGRKRAATPTPIAEWAASAGREVVKPENVNMPEVRDRIRATPADAWVVIAFGQKLSPELLEDRFAINLHASLLPKYRGAAPINHAILGGETRTGLSVITLADRMDAGLVLGTCETPIDPMETAGELHDRLAMLGPDLVTEVLRRFEAGELTSQTQDDAAATRAPKLSKADACADFSQPADAVRRRVHGLTPWPGCRVRIEGRDLILLRVAVADPAGVRRLGDPEAEPGTLLEGGVIACGTGGIRLLSVQPPGKRAMSFEAYRNGHPVEPGARIESP